MRIIAGSARGRKLFSPEGMDVRPTTDKVKESLFNIIQFEIPGARVLDLFSGTGQLGLEALSRGAESAVFLDNSRRSLDAVRKNLLQTGLQEKAEVICADTVLYLRSCKKTFDIAYLDPPYQQGLLQKTLPLLPAVMSKSGVIVCEHPTEEQLPQEIGSFALKKNYKYGKIMISVYSSKEVEGL